MNGDEITICCLNAQGLNNDLKRRDVFDRLHNKHFSIVCLVDTHFDKSKERIYSAEWGYSTCYSSFNSQSRGVSIMFKNNFEFKIHNTYRDTNGNLLVLDIEIEKRRISLAVLYGPNIDTPTFYNDLQNIVTRMGNANIIMVGDWNLLLDPSVDGTNYKHINNPQARQRVLKMMAELNLFDIFRCENSEKRLFTWKRKLQSGDIQMGRLDFFLISESLVNFTQKERIHPAYRSDHSSISLSLIFNEILKTKTFWKFNNSLLKNHDYVNEIKQLIIDIKKQYAATPYYADNIGSIANEHFKLNINPQLFFEMILLEVRSKSISFSSALKKKENVLVKTLEKEIKILEDRDASGNYDDIQSKQTELKSIRETKLRGMLIRSKARWIEHGERASNYFCNLENRHFVSKRMASLIDKHNNEITNYDLINKEVFSFYNKLYESKEENITNVDLNELLDINTPTLNDIESNAIEGNITLAEAALSLSNMKNNKSPGSSGFNVEFFKFFWKDLGVFLVNSINYGFSNKELSSTQKEGVITCIPKSNKSKKYIKNWRPISLLNVTYKIASGCIASRIKTVLPTIIDLDQSGFMSNRFTGDNIRLMYDTLKFSMEQRKTGLLLLIDFEKAFDSIAWSFIKKCLLFFNFKPDIISWIETFYRNIKSTVIVNNKPTPWFAVERGCRQGDPISPYIFLICGEILAHMIRQKKEIKGFVLFGKEIKISQFADDTSLFLDGSKESFEYCIYTVLEYAKYSGLAMNYDKTKVVWFGCEHPPNTVFLPHLNFEWNPKTFSMLGVDFTIDLKNITDINILKKLTEITNDLNQWSKRDLTPFGKVTVIKTLIISKIVHILIALPTPSLKLLNEINKLLYTFLWNGKPDQIKRTIAKQKLINGGLGMIDIHLFDKALKLTWIKRYFNSASKWKSIVEAKYPKISNIRHFGSKYVENLCKNVTNPFWQNVLTYYTKYSISFQINSENELNMSPIMYNYNITVGKKPIQSQILINNNVFFLKQIKIGDRFMTINELNTTHRTNLNFLQYNSIMSSIRIYVNKLGQLKKKKDIPFQPALNTIMMTKKGAAPIYKDMLINESKISGIERWSKLTPINLNNWMKSFNILISTTKDTKLRWLQFRILHHILTTNRSVSKFNRDQNHLCTFCGVHSETILHLLWECSKTKLFWRNLETVINNRCLHAFNFKFTTNIIIFGFCDQMRTDKVCEFIIYMAKFYIYRCKVQSICLNIKIFIKELYNRYVVEKIISKNSSDFRNNWGPYLKLFQSIL